MNPPPDLTVISGGKPEEETLAATNPSASSPDAAPPSPADTIELALPKTASEAFMFLAVRAAERFARDPKEQQWALISEVFKKLAEFTTAFPYASARHVKWGYAVVYKRVPQAQSEAGPLVKWLDKIPALATDKAAAAPLLWHYIASCAGQYAASIPVPRGKPGAWEYMKGELTIPCSNEDAYMLSQQRHFWSTYQGRLLYVVGVLLQEMAGVPVPQAAVAPAGEVERAGLQVVPAADGTGVAKAPEGEQRAEQPALAQDADTTPASPSPASPPPPSDL